NPLQRLVRTTPPASLPARIFLTDQGSYPGQRVSSVKLSELACRAYPLAGHVSRSVAPAAISRCWSEQGTSQEQFDSVTPMCPIVCTASLPKRPAKLVSIAWHCHA